ncbi:MAG: DUF1552 domain-containing protein [Opitutaceae bacterium]
MLHLSRRTFLKGIGVACFLPYMEAMERDAKTRAMTGALAKRACFIYTPNGVSLPPEGNPAREDWHWFPHEAGRDFKFNKVHAALAPYREQLSYWGGLSHPKSRELLGHIAGDTWLTGGDVGGSEYKNSISVDQVAAAELGKQTRYSCLSLSCDGGVGYKSRASTLSFDNTGKALPTESSPRELFERYFAAGSDGSKKERRKQLQQGKKIVDAVMDETKSLNRKLGAADQAKMDEYMSSLSDVEGRIERTESWIDVPLKNVNVNGINLDITQKAPEEYIRTMFDIILLTFQTDSARVVSYMIAREDGMGFGDKFPVIALGLKGHHSLSHDRNKGGFERMGKYDEFLAKQYAYFLDRLSKVSDESGPLLDTTMTMYGSCCSTVHNARNYPIILAGGKKLGIDHGKYTVHKESVPLSNLYVSMLRALDVPADKFADSTGNLDKHLLVS